TTQVQEKSSPHGKKDRTVRHTRLYLFMLLSLLTLAACSPGSTTASSLPSTTPTNQPTSTTPVVSVACPAPGKARAAVLPSLSGGTDQHLVYLLNTGSAGSLQRYDVTTGVTRQIISLAQTNSHAVRSPDAASASPNGGGHQTVISDAALSPDG